MVNLDSNKKIYLFGNDISFRLGIDGLTNLILTKFPLNEVYKNIYVFFNKNGKQVRILEFDEQGTWLYQKKLKEYRYMPPNIINGQIKIDIKQLKIIFNNLKLVNKRVR